MWKKRKMWKKRCLRGFVTPYGLKVLRTSRAEHLELIFNMRDELSPHATDVSSFQGFSLMFTGLDMNDAFTILRGFDASDASLHWCSPVLLLCPPVVAGFQPSYSGARRFFAGLRRFRSAFAGSRPFAAGARRSRHRSARARSSASRRRVRLRRGGSLWRL